MTSMSRGQRVARKRGIQRQAARRAKKALTRPVTVSVAGAGTTTVVVTFTPTGGSPQVLTGRYGLVRR